MTDLHDRFRNLDRVRAPDLWSEATTRAANDVKARASWPFAISPALRMGLVLLTLLLITSIGLAAAAALLRNDRGGTGPAYEAVFLRVEVDGDTSDVLAVGVNADGDEREIARLADAWLAYPLGTTGEHLAPMGAVSHSGLLAMPSTRGDWPMVQWEIFDLYRPADDPIVVAVPPQDVEMLQVQPNYSLDMLPSVFWGPGERVAIVWSKRIPDPTDSRSFFLEGHLSFVEGRTGATRSVEIPGERDRMILPEWAADGSGVLVGSLTADVETGILRPNGAITDFSGPVAESACRTRDESGGQIAISDGRVERVSPDGMVDPIPAPRVAYACLSPDDSMIALALELGHGNVSASRPMALMLGANGASFEIEGYFAGWLELNR